MIYVILRHRKMRNVTNFFLANLAVSDLCVGLFCVLPNLSTFLSPCWVLGKVSNMESSTVYEGGGWSVTWSHLLFMRGEGGQ